MHIFAAANIPVQGSAISHEAFVSFLHAKIAPLARLRHHISPTPCVLRHHHSYSLWMQRTWPVICVHHRCVVVTSFYLRLLSWSNRAIELYATRQKGIGWPQNSGTVGYWLVASRFLCSYLLYNKVNLFNFKYWIMLPGRTRFEQNCWTMHCPK